MKNEKILIKSEQLVYDQAVLSTNKQSWLEYVEIFLTHKGKLALMVENHDGDTWYVGKKIVDVLSEMDMDNLITLLDLISNEVENRMDRLLGDN